MDSRPMTVKNSPNVSAWNLESGYTRVKKSDEESDENVLDTRSLLHNAVDGGKIYSLDFIVSNLKNDSDSSCTVLDGTYITLSLPGEETAEIAMDDYLGFDEDFRIMIDAKLYDISKGLSLYKPEERKCFFSSDGSLRFLKTYTKINCVYECLLNFTKEECGCVLFSWPRDNGTKICGTKRMQCVEAANTDFNNEIDKLMRECNCIHSCKNIEYRTKIERTRLYLEGARRSQLKENSTKDTQVSIYFKDRAVKVVKRVETYTVTDFSVNCGGLLGLFLGTSLLSLIEIVYFATIRLFWMIYRPRPQKIEVIPHIPFPESSQNNMTRQLRYFWHMMRIFWVEFCANSSIRYLAPRKSSHWSERLYWVITIGIALGLCGVMIENTYTKWRMNPVKTNTEEIEMPFPKFTFPTVTICPEIKTSKLKVDITSLLNSKHNLSENNKLRLQALSYVCPLFLNYVDLTDNYVEPTDNFTSDLIYNSIEDIAPKFDSTLMSCNMNRVGTPCSNLMNPVATDDGLCFTFNALNSRDMYTDEMASRALMIEDGRKVWGWNWDTGYKQLDHYKNYPLQAFTVFSVQLGTFLNDAEHRCEGIGHGFKIILSRPGEALQSSQNYFRLPLSYLYTLNIKPTFITTASNLRHYKPYQRKCFYQDERRLRFFKVYAEINCEVECLANFTKTVCECVKFSMPRDSNTKICGVAKMRCLNEARKNFWASNNGNSFRENCDCLPTCEYVQYNTETFRLKLDMVNNMHTVHELDKQEETHLIVHYYDEPWHHPVKKTTKSELYSVADFLAVCGGLLGLFVGASVLSIIELVYFATLHLFWKVRFTQPSNAITPLNDQVENPPFTSNQNTNQDTCTEDIEMN